MDIERLLNLDYRKNNEREEITKLLEKLVKPLNKVNGLIPLEDIENTIGKMVRKYEVQIQYINVCMSAGKNNIYNVSIKKSNTHEWLGNCYGITLREAFEKTLLKIFYHIKNGDVKLKDSVVNE